MVKLIWKLLFFKSESCKVLEGKVESHEGEVARLMIGKYNLDAIFNSKKMWMTKSIWI